MKEYEFKATNLIAEAFEQRGIKFDVVKHYGVEQLLAGFSIKSGPNVIMRFISRNDDNDVAVRIFSLVSDTPKEKHLRLMEVCNILNRKFRYIKFCIDTDGNINVEHDFPLESHDHSVGNMAFEILIRMMKDLNDEYSLFMKALYTDEALDTQKKSLPAEFIRELQEVCEAIEARKAAERNNDDDEEDDEDDYEDDDDNEDEDDYEDDDDEFDMNIEDVDIAGFNESNQEEADSKPWLRFLRKKWIDEASERIISSRISPENPPTDGAQSETPIGIDGLISRINARIDELEAEEKNQTDNKYHVLITSAQGSKAKVAEMISNATGESFESAAKKLSEFPVDLSFKTQIEAMKFKQKIIDVGGEAALKTS